MWPAQSLGKSEHCIKYGDSIGISLLPERILTLSLLEVTTINIWLIVAGIRH